MDDKRREAILNKPLYPVIFSIAFPLIINNLIQTLYNLADGVWLGQLGKLEFSATAFVWPIIFLFVSLGFGISVAGISILSRLIGANQPDEANNYASHLLITALVVSVVFSILGYVLSPYIISAMGATGELNQFSNIYLKISFMGYPFVVLFFVFQSIMNAQGDTKSTTMVSAFTAVINIILDPFFIFDRIPWFGLKGLNMGIAGAAYATILSQALMMILGYLTVRFRSKEIGFKKENFQFEFSRIKKIIRVGFPSAIGQSGSALGFLILNVFITAYGTDVLAAYSMVNRISGLLTQPSMGFGGALTSVAGQNMGANQKNRVREAFSKTLTMSLLFGIIGAIIMYIFRYPLLHFFIKDQSGTVFREAIPYLMYSLLIIPLMGIFNVLMGLFNGTGNTHYSMRMTVGRLWVLRIPMVLLFKHFSDLGSTGIWISMLMSNLLTVIYGYVLYRKGEWEEKQL